MFEKSKQQITKKKSLKLQNTVQKIAIIWKMKKTKKNNIIKQVDDRKDKATDNKKEVSEIAKYSAKDSDYLEDEKVFDTFYKSLSGKRLIVYSGLFKDASKLYENKELEKYK